MTDLLSDVETPSDAELISRVRGGDVAAYGDLFSRHKDAAQRLARQLVRGPDSDDLVSEAFAKVLSVLQGGGGPDVAFRAYLLTSVRRLHVDRIRSGQRVQTTDDLTPFDPGVPFQDTAVAGFESGAAAKAFASLPERWQLVLWHLEVEGQKPADIAPLLGMSANSVSALAYRAREGLRQAFLTMHISDLTETDCRWVNEHLGAFIRRGLSKRDAGKVQAHLDDCRRCTAMYLELTEVNSNLAGIIAPLLLGGAAAGYLASTGGVGAAGVLGLLSKVKEFVAANSGAVTAAGVAAGVATAAAVAAVTLGGSPAQKRDVVANPPATVTTTPAAPAPSLPLTSAPAKAKQPNTASTTASPSSSASTSPSEPATSASGSTTPSTVVGPAVTAPTQEQTDTPAPSDGETAGPTPVTVSTVDLSGTTVDENGVHFRALGSPELPPVMTVRLTSQPSGVTFDPAGSDCNVAADGLSAVCSPVSGGLGGTVPGAAAAATPSSYAAELPFLIPEGQTDTDIDIDVDVPQGFEVAGGVAHLRPYTSRTADVQLVLESPVPYAPGGYAVVAHLSGLPAGYTGPVRILKVEGEATIAGSATAGCTVDAGTLLCSHPADTVRFVLDSVDPTKASPVRLRVAALTGYRDPAGANNASTVTLEAKPVVIPDADLALTLDGPVEPASDSHHLVTGHLTGVPAGYAGTVTFTISGAPGAPDESADFGDSAGCTRLPRMLICDAPASGTQVFNVVTNDPTRAHKITISVLRLTDFTDDADGNNHPTVELKPVPAVPTHNVSLSGLVPVQPTADSGGAQEFTATLNKDGFTGKVSFSLLAPSSGAALAAPVDPVDGTVRFKVTSASTTPFAVRISADVPADANDPDLTNNSNPQPLNWVPHPYDIKLTGLAPVTPQADASGSQEFTATLDKGGFTGKVSFSLVTPTSGVTLTAPVNPADGTVHFTITSQSRTPLDVTIRADAPAEANDPDPSNNSNPTSLMWTPPSVQPFAFEGPPTALATGPNDFDVLVKVKDIPAGATEVVLSVPSPQEKVNTAVGPCTVTDAHTVTCRVPSGATSLTMRFNAQLPGKSNAADRNPLTAKAGSSTVTTQITFQ